MSRPATDEPTPRLSVGAVVSLVLGLASLLLLFLTGIPALWVGLQSLRAVHASDGRLRGKRLAAAGMALGALGCAASVVGLLVVGFAALQVRSQRLECLNHFRLIGGAVLGYYDGHKAFPPGTVSSAALPPDRRLSWLTTLPPYIGENTPAVAALRAAADRLDPALAWDEAGNAAVAHAPAPLFRCPGDAVHDPRAAPGLTDYVGFTGVGADAAALRRGDPMAGVFGYDRTTTRDDVTAGTSRTLLAGETTRDNGPWTAGGTPTLRGVVPDDAPFIGPGRPFGGTHPGGMNVLWADGSAGFMEETIAPRLFEDLTRIRR